ncbi:MAG: endonuclease/exonuclease/phosphatase family protein [Bacteroidota bacterium]|nr:endonuclease/exonuclease/phosphatase family protein [Bacteroidota bacterium]
MRKFFSNILFNINLVVAVLLVLAYLSVYINPQHFWPLAFLGLLYPFLLIANIAFIIIWAIRLKRQVFLSLIVILVGWTFLSRYIQLNLPLSSKKENSEKHIDFKILSYNVRLFDLYNWVKKPNTGQGIFGLVKREAPDIICFQEFYTREKGNFSESGIIGQLKHAKYQHIKYTLRKSKGSSFGIATFSTYPIVKRGEIHFSKTYNACIFSDIKIDEDTIRVYNCHLQSVRFIKSDYDFIDTLKFKYSQKQVNSVFDITTRLKWAFRRRALQADSIAAHIRRSPHPVIVCGDFNDSPVSYTYQTIRQNLHDAFIEAGSGIGHTYLGKFPAYRIDYILYDKSFEAEKYHSPKLELSDHYPVLCEISKK